MWLTPPGICGAQCKSCRFLHVMTSGVLHKLCPLQDLQQATTLHFEFYSDVQQAGRGAAGYPDATAARGTQGGLTIINLPGLHRYSESEHAILERLVKRFKVPQRLRYSRVSAPRVGCLRRLPGVNGVQRPLLASCRPLAGGSTSCTRPTYLATVGTPLAAGSSCWHASTELAALAAWRGGDSWSGCAC